MLTFPPQCSCLRTTRAATANQRMMAHKDESSSGHCSSSSTASCTSSQAAPPLPNRKLSSRTSSTTTPTSPPSSTGLGRKGDARMHKAVAIRLAQPQLSLFAALREGGFDYTVDQSDAKDSDGVCLSQRKNQLSRRLRLSGKKRNVDVLSTDPSLQLDGSNNSSSVCNEHHDSHRRPLVLAKHHPRFAPPYTASSQQHTTKNTTITSSTALQSLTVTAQHVGLSLDQLADRLAQHPQLLQQAVDTTDASATALSLYQAQLPLVRSRVLVAAGFPMDTDVSLSQAEYDLRVAAWRAEGQALGQLPIGAGDDTTTTTTTTDSIGKATAAAAATRATSSCPAPALLLHKTSNTKEDTDGESSHAHSHSHQSPNEKEAKDSPPEPCCIHDRHLHRLEGKVRNRRPMIITVPYVYIIVSHTYFFSVRFFCFF